MSLLTKFLVYGFAHHSRICIIGGGTAGVNVSAHLLRSGIPPKDITIFQPGKYHYYQPGWTLVGRGMLQPQATREPMQKVIPDMIHTIKQHVKLVKPEQNLVITDRNHEYAYDHLIIASGFVIDWDRIKGARELLEDPYSKVCSIYDYNFSFKTARLAERYQGGKAIFTEPKLPIKCAGAPVKIVFLWDEAWGKKLLVRHPPQLVKAEATMFMVPKYGQALAQLARQRGIKATFQHNLIEVTDKKAIFEQVVSKQRLEKQYDFLHLVPPMSAPAFIGESGLGNLAGFVEVDAYTLRHQRHPNIWSLGDSSSLPCSKTAAAVFVQTPVLVKNLMTVLKDPSAKTLPERYNGYSGCPMMLGVGKGIMAEFLYDKKVDETFFSDQEKPRLFFYLMTRYLFPFAYWKLMPRGLWQGRNGIRLTW